MNIPLRQILGCIILLHLFSTGAVAQSAIDSLEIQGNRHVSPVKIKRIIRLRVGDSFDDQSISEAIKRLYATKEFSDIEAYKEVVDGKLKILLVVKEYPKIDFVRFEGNKHVKEDDLTPVVSIKEGAFVRPALLRKDHEAVEDLYREKGYYRVELEDEIVTEQDKKTKKSNSVLVYRINEGEKVSIKHIDFFGNRSLDSEQIRKVMQSKQDRWYRGADFKPRVLERDLASVDSLYRTHGFLDVEVRDRELIFSEDGKDLDIFVTIEEGPQYRVGQVSWAGNTIFSDAQIGPLVTFRPGAVFDDTEFSMIQIGISSLYWDRGYIYNSVSPDKTVKGEEIDIHFDITEGKPAYLREISISGNTKTSERVIRRELVMNPGEVFSRPKLQRSLREVFNLGFFNGPPQVGTTPANSEGDINIDLRVEERQTGQFRLGAGFSALNSISGFIGLAETNFLGRGYQIGFDWEFSKYRQNFDVRFTNPWLMGTPTQLSVNAFNRVQNQVRQQFYSDRRRGASMRLGRPFPWFDYTSLFWRYRYEEITLSNFSSFYEGPLLDIDWPQRTSSMSLTLLRNSTDSPFRPTMGTKASISAEIAGGALGGDVRYQLYEAGFSWYETLLWRFTLQVRYHGAVIDGFDSPSDVPDYERFRLGGNRRFGVRGYDFYEIVPEGNPLYLGGRFMQILSYEVTIPFAPTVWGLLFLDTGNTWNGFAGSDPFDLRKGMGLGIRIEIPMLGMVGFDYGYGFDKIGGGAWEPHLSLGAGF